jgi:hypothetical protein
MGFAHSPKSEPHHCSVATRGFGGVLFNYSRRDAMIQLKPGDRVKHKKAFWEGEVVEVFPDGDVACRVDGLVGTSQAKDLYKVI